MKGAQIILGELGGREAAGLIIDGALDDLFVDSDAPRLGTIYRARVDRTAQGQGGAFLKGPEGQLYLRQAKGLKAGDTLLVQVSGHAEVGKATPVTPRLLFKSRYAIVTPDAPGLNISRSIRDEDERLAIRASAETVAAEGSAHGLILRSSCSGAPDDDIASDVDAMLSLADQVLADGGDAIEKLLDGDGPHTLAWREWPSVAVDEGDLRPFLDQLDTAKVPLGHNACMFVEATRALVAVDVNTGGDSSPAAGLKANLAAARLLPRALRLRGLAGQIVMDLAPMPKKDRKTIESALRVALRSDAVETTIVGWTPLGHVELSRKRDRPTLREVLN